MTFAAPLFAWIAGGVAAGTVVLHLLAWRRPPPSPLPTVRFIPERPVRMVSRAIRPTDLALLAMRVLLVLLVGLALAGPAFARRPRGTARVVVVDRSRAAGDGSAVADTARALLGPGDALVVFDSAAREMVGATPDSIAVTTAGGAGSVSAALVAAVRAAHRLRGERDSVEIVVVSPFAAEELDAATASVRRAWPGPVRLVRAGRPPNDTMLSGAVALRAPAGDPVAAAFALAGDVRGGTGVRVVRDALTPADSAWASSGRLVVLWPSAPEQSWPRAPAPDTAFAVVATEGHGAGPGERAAATVVARFVRRALPPAGRVVARWSDGAPAATEQALGDGCIRSVAVAVPSIGDLALTPAFRHFARRMAEPCGGGVGLTPVPDSVLAALLPPTIAGRARPVPMVPAAERAEPVSRMTAWLLGLALVVALAEMLVRRGETHATA